eukprot:12430517-Alexandrium_andersonii.AAC.1
MRLRKPQGWPKRSNCLASVFELQVAAASKLLPVGLQPSAADTTDQRAHKLRMLQTRSAADDV